MNNSPWRLRVVGRYALFQIPGIMMVLLGTGLAAKWMGLPFWIAMVIISLWVAKDIVLFPFVWRSYDRARLGDSFSMIGMCGTVLERLAPSGYLLVRGERWRGYLIEDEPFVEKGETVRVCEVKGLTLLVERETNEPLEKEVQH